MSHRLQIALIFIAPLLVLAGLLGVGALLGMKAPLLGRNYVVRMILPEPGGAVGLPEILGPEDASRPLVVIDAGHGGHDPGASAEGLQEKAIALGLARALRDKLLREGGIRVAMTRDDDSYLVLEERAEIARRLGADLFLSIHADSAGDKSAVTGASVYTLSERASSEAAARFAARENSVDTVNGVELANQDARVNAILIDLAQRRSQQGSDEFARLIVREGAEKLKFNPQPLRSAALVVLKSPDVPSALFEAGFVSNPEDAGRLASPEGQARFAEAMAQAIRIYFAREAGA
ncbi:N-acetylmuramoyl-L-alanine amidase [Croceibacterium sp. LX-88]|uniref:N-acetylmuramoyl-L-alanine amidase n=1 Tax=Croceibacterium selenioxidans TaxID=2838833 RepID=A0ABS5W484_9SPHN|nr:N-acetylmuramoyl-L-alanine amidase [Croceibacterium selenioxidans]MBT2133887.1 N-acetylmuramoyl-L-alanine amidase [Croceibacterium selenioxidans]